MSDNEATPDLQGASERKQQLMKQIKERQRAAALKELTASELASLREKVFDVVCRRSGSITAEDIVNSSTSLGVAETPKACQSFLERTASDKRALTFDDFVVYWVTPVLGTNSRKFPLWKSSLQTAYYSEIEREKRARVVTNPFGDNPSAAVYATIGNVGDTPKSSITLTAVPNTKAGFNESLRNVAPIQTDEEDNEKIPRIHARVYVDLNDGVPLDDAREVLEMFSGVLEEVGKEHSVFSPQVSFDEKANAFVFDIIMRESSDPIVEMLQDSKADCLAAESLGGKFFHGATVRLGFHSDVSQVLALTATTPLRSLVDAMDVRGHVVWSQKIVREIIVRLVANKWFKGIQRNRESKIVELLFLVMMVKVFSGVSYRAEFANFSEVLQQVFSQIENVSQETLTAHASTDDDIEGLLRESSLVREKVQAILQRRTRHDSAVIDFLPFLGKKVSFEKFLGGSAIEERRCILLGPAATGKTTCLYALKLGEVVTTIPTIGFNVETVKIPTGNSDVTVWDLGGDAKLIPLWRHYVTGQPGETVIFFINGSSSSKQSDEQVKEAAQSLQDLDCSNVVFLITHDGTNTMPESKLRTLLSIPEDAQDVVILELDIRNAISDMPGLLGKALSGRQSTQEEPEEPTAQDSDILDGADEVMMELMFRLRAIAKGVSRARVSSHYASAELVLDNINLIKLIPESAEAMNEAYKQSKARNRIAKCKKAASQAMTFDTTRNVCESSKFA
jgi:hypothetical protein